MNKPSILLLVAFAAAILAIAGCTNATEPAKKDNTTQPPDLFTEKGQSKNATECASASDCAVGGCSGQVCTTAAKAQGLITTCEYREEYGCMKLTSCGCIQGKCTWRDNPQYAACINKAKST